MENEPIDGTQITGQHVIFVYGTLRKGLWNHSLLRSAKFLGNAKTKLLYALYGNEVVFLSRTKAVSQVTGEVYSIDDDTLYSLDELEGHPLAYKREQAEVILEDGIELSAWIYFCDVGRGDLIESGDYFLRASSPRRRKRSV